MDGKTDKLGRKIFTKNSNYTLLSCDFYLKFKNIGNNFRTKNLCRIRFTLIKLKGELFYKL